MHAFSHSLAHRAPPATRRVRWQPYTTLSSQSSNSSSSKSPSSQVSTPSSSILSSPNNTHLSDHKQHIATQNHKETATPRDPPKNKYAVGLVDQAVKTLCEIWRPQDIPPVFLSSSRPAPVHSTQPESLTHKIALHRPVGSVPITTPIPFVLTSSASGNDSAGCLVPIKGFVHEVIRRSRTSGCVLQTALCYLEAIRPKVPDLAHKEQSGLGVQGEMDLSTRITLATELELKLEEQNQSEFLPPHFGSQSLINSENAVPTIRIDDIEPSPLGEQNQNPAPIESSAPTPPFLPSPLLCPRRTFLAALILASKFTQDKCYSNRAWAKLSGLPAREIGRCERALGDALEWRLWVGKSPAQSQQGSASPIPNNPTSRTVARSQSESSMSSLPSTRSPFLVRPDVRHQSALPTSQKTLQKSYTMPAESFGAPSGVWSPMDSQVPTPSLRCTQQSLNGFSIPIASHIYADALSQSPSPENPGLSYSPSSTESSSGDRTIQMATFFDEPMGPHSAPQAPTATEFWPWSDNGDVSQDLRVSPLAITKNNRSVKPLMGPDNLAVYTVTGMPHDMPTITSKLFWSAEGEPHRPPTLLTQ